MKIIAFALFCVLFGSFGNYPPPAEKIQVHKVTQNKESVRPGFAKRERHRAIRSKSGHAQLPTHSGLSTTIPGRVYPLADSLLYIPQSSPWSVSSQTNTQPMLVFFTNMTYSQIVGEEHQQWQAAALSPSPRSVSPQTETLTDSVAVEICLSVEEKKLYDLIMAYRKSKRLPPIPYSAKLSKVAQAHVHDLEANYNYENASTCNPHSWSDKGTWTSCCYTSDHKQANCMWTKPKEIAGYEGYGYEIAYYSSAGANATEGLEGWKKSPGHNPLIVNLGTWSKVKWQAIGIGIYGQYGVVWFGEEADESKMKLCK